MCFARQGRKREKPSSSVLNSTVAYQNQTLLETYYILAMFLLIPVVVYCSRFQERVDSIDPMAVVRCPIH